MVFLDVRGRLGRDGMVSLSVLYDYYDKTQENLKNRGP